MNPAVTTRIVLSLAIGSLRKTRSRTVVVGCLMAFGALLTVGGTALLDSIDRTMTGAITGSMAGHLQVYAVEAKDKLALYGGGFMGSEDIGTLPDFGAVEDALSRLDNVAAVVPMGKQFASVLALNETDAGIEELRRTHATPGRARDLAVAKVRQLASLILDERTKVLEISRDRATVEREVEHARHVVSDDFWQELDRDPEAALTYLDVNLAPLDRSGDVFYLNLLGTDVDRFRQVFAKFRITDGRMLPPGERGLLMSKYTYEKWAKNKLARGFDTLHEELRVKHRALASAPELQTLARQMAAQTGHVTFGLTPDAAAELEAELTTELPGVKGGLPELLKAFLTIDDQTFDRRYAFFYRHVAPRIRLYRYPVGSTLTLTVFTKSGYVKSRNVTFWGTYSFEGMEKTEIAGVYSLIDLPSYRDLFGRMDAARVEELQGIRAAVGVADVDRAKAEDALFGGGQPVEQPAAEAASPETSATAAAPTAENGVVPAPPRAGFDEFADGGAEALRRAREQALADPVTPEAIRNGFFEHAAIVLHDPERLAETRAAVEALSKERGLGLQVMDWEEASGVVGQFVIVVRIVLYIAIFIIFVVALVIINNSLVMTTLERTAEIGTMRALGAEAGFVLSLFLTETLLLGLASGAVGALAAWGLVGLLGHVGIPASGDALTFLFGGPRLYPEVHAGNVAAGLVVILFVSVAAACFPAVVAARIRPAVAMRTKE